MDPDRETNAIELLFVCVEITPVVRVGVTLLPKESVLRDVVSAMKTIKLRAIDIAPVECIRLDISKRSSEADSHVQQVLI